jgi:RND family efflux transporter MFP subunit
MIRALVFSFILLGALAACSKDSPTSTSAAKPASPVSAAIPVETAKPEPAGSANAIRVTGTLSANVELRLSFKTGGILKRLLVDTGQNVRAGQLLAELDRTEVGAGATQMRMNLAKAERDYVRAESLFKQDVIPKAQLDDARTALEVARAGSVAMNFNSDSGRITAEKDGVVLRRFVEAGEVVAPGAPILALSQGEAKKVLKVSLSDVDAVRVNIGDAAEVSFDAMPGVKIRAHVLTLAGSANPGTGLFEIELALDEATERLSSGMIGQAVIQPDGEVSDNFVPDGASTKQELLLIPLAALVEANAEHGLIYVVENNFAKSRQIALGEIRGEQVLVLGGLSANESVVVRGAPYLDDGTPVTHGTQLAEAASVVSVVENVPGAATANTELNP